MNINLICLPFAGGSAAVYRDWVDFVAPYINVIPLEYAGRGKRFIEPLYENFESCIEDLYNIVIKHIENNENFALFGHSMGAHIAYELTLKLKTDNVIPKHLFISSRVPPHLSHINYSSLTKEQFLLKLEKMGGTQKEFFKNKELIDIYLPIIRNDFRILEEYLITNHTVRSDGVMCNTSGFFGKEENIFEEMQEWKQYIDKEYNVFKMQGNHFYLNIDKENLINLINLILSD
ncbi:thioesterase [Lysinibacillus sphaericus]|uniref:NrsA n=1 Tax=Lysinibacillus sphaericus TaxID=1421 RepID=A0A2S0K2X2_LYSSH|nr:thioesterase domain-containing protein [Lysinibacillus sphaericus]AVK97691.1 thioesterase [Lysinibacillus sphaericus]MED4543918.1 thioesterase domain-containing protein [Lysinibacillus sphaericus]TKI15778.1 thioesterase [Lysinibacillus sphaericus]SUV16389.1 NrsA [Lysinibacillus sphaericus]GEC84453.1 thioesterase [Lysinibacillus sphaericus]